MSANLRTHIEGSAVLFLFHVCTLMHMHTVKLIQFGKKQTFLGVLERWLSCQGTVWSCRGSGFSSGTHTVAYQCQELQHILGTKGTRHVCIENTHKKLKKKKKTLAVLETTLQTRVVTNSQSSTCLCLPSSRIKVIQHHHQRVVLFCFVFLKPTHKNSMLKLF